MGSERRLKLLLKVRNENHLWMSVFCTLLPSLINNSSGRTGLWKGHTTVDVVTEDTAMVTWEPGQGRGRKEYSGFSFLLFLGQGSALSISTGEPRAKEPIEVGPVDHPSRAQSNTEKGREKVGGQMKSNQFRPLPHCSSQAHHSFSSQILQAPNFPQIKTVPLRWRTPAIVEKKVPE